MNNYKALLLLPVLLISINAYSQYNKMSYNEMLLQKFKAKGTDYHDKSLLKQYLKKFDANYNNYYTNEFEFGKKLNETQNKIEHSIQNIDENKVYYLDFQREFGEYDFTKKQFSFQPFSKVEEAEKGNSYYYTSITGNKDNETEDMSCSVFLRDFSFVNGIAIDENSADNFLKTKKYKNDFGYEKINRDVFIRVYYVVNSEMIKIIKGSGPWYEDKEYLKGEPLRVEVWGDKCQANELIATYYPNKNDISQKFYSLFEKLKSDKPISNNYTIHAPSENFKYLYSWNKLNNKCTREYIELHIKKQHAASEQNILQFRLFTNYNYNIKPGFIFNFFNKETNIEFPLVIYEAYVDNGVSLLKVKITDKTLSQIINAQCTSLKLQLTGYPKYSLPGGGVMFSNGIDWGGPEIWLYLNDQNKQVLLSTLGDRPNDDLINLSSGSNFSEKIL